MLAFKVEFVISQSNEIERENSSLARKLELMHHDSQQANPRDKVTDKVQQQVSSIKWSGNEVLSSIDLDHQGHLDSDSEGPDEDYTPQDTQFRVENPEQFLRQMPDLKHAECDKSVVEPSHPDGIANDVPSTIKPKFSSNHADDQKQLTASSETVSFSVEGYRANQTSLAIQNSDNVTYDYLMTALLREKNEIVKQL